MKKTIKAIWAITKADLKATFRNPASLVFGFLFPMIFIAIFGFLGGNGQTYEIGILDGTNKENPVYKALDELDVISLQEIDQAELQHKLERGQIDGAIKISDGTQTSPIAEVLLKTTVARPESAQVLDTILKSIADGINIQANPNTVSAVTLQTEEIAGREYKTIDFILPGQLGFALLSSGVFGTAFLFVNLRQTLVLKRFFTAPIDRSTIVIGEAMSKLLFASLQAGVIVIAGAGLFGFTLVNGVWTFGAMILLSLVGLIVFLGFGFVVSSIAKDENTVPPIANLITLPQFLLSGTFFPIEAFPGWLQPVSKALPLTYLNDAMRKVAFEGESLLSLQKEFAVLLIWCVIIYALAIKIFKWQ